MPTHGLDYETAFLDSLPTVPSCDPTSPPIPVLSTDKLAELHLRHITSHAPDHVVFPFLHGVEGTNAAQNMFFSSADAVPRYRGLMYVVCEDELDDDSDDDSDDLDSSSDMEVDTDFDLDVREMDNDGVAVHVGDEVMEIAGIGETERGETGKVSKEAHMHPVAMRPPPPLVTPEYPSCAATYLFQLISHFVLLDTIHAVPSLDHRPFSHPLSNQASSSTNAPRMTGHLFPYTSQMVSPCETLAYKSCVPFKLFDGTSLIPLTAHTGYPVRYCYLFAYFDGRERLAERTEAGRTFQDGHFEEEAGAAGQASR